MLPLVILVMLAAGAYASGLHHLVSLERIAEHRDWLMSYVRDHLFTALGLYMLVYISVVALSLPGGLVLTLIGGFLFGGLIGGTATVIAATTGAVLVFEIVQTSIGDALAKRAGPWLSRLSDGFRRDAFHYMMFLRLVPVFPFWLINIAPALLNVSRPVYIITTILGIIPATYAFATLGAGLDSVIVKQRMLYDACVMKNGLENCTFSIDPRALVTRELLVACAALGVVALIPLAVKRWAGRGKGEKHR